MNDPAPPATVSILPVDDDPEVRAMVAMSLRQAGLRVVEAGSGRLALGSHVQVAVDDAGAGFASMRHILELRPTFAKLDMSLVRGIDDDDLRQGLAAGLNYFALRTGVRLIAEGVETQAEADALQRVGIELGQGYLYGRPARVADLAAGSAGPRPGGEPGRQTR
jgi:predicted signal transduction protein with EAL and GGDEF domain